MVDKQSVIQSLVAVVQILQVQVLSHIVSTRTQMAHAPRHLALECSHSRGNQSTQTQAVSLTVGEGQRLVPQRIVQNIKSTLSRLQGSGILLHVYSGQRAQVDLGGPKGAQKLIGTQHYFQGIEQIQRLW